MLTYRVLAGAIYPIYSIWLVNDFADSDMSCLETVERENNKDYNQVLLDVQRSLRRFPPGE